MNEELDIKKLFSDYQPQMTDSAEFMAALNSKLDAVESVKAYHDAQIRKCRTTALIAFIAGCAVGAFLIAILILKPATTSQLALLLDSNFYVFLMSYKFQIMAIIGTLVILGALVPILKSGELKA